MPLSFRLPNFTADRFKHNTRIDLIAKKIGCLLQILILVASAPVAWGKALTIEGENYRLEREDGSHNYSNAYVTVGDLKIRAGRLRYLESEALLTFKEDVVLESSTTLFTADSATYRLDSKIAVLLKATAFDKIKKAYVTAEKIERLTDDSFIVHNGTITYCHPDSPAWEVRSDYVHYETADHAYAYNSFLHLHAVPIFYTPYIAWPTTRSRGSGFLAPVLTSRNSSDESKDYGSRLKIPYFVNLDRDHDVTITADAIQRRGVGVDADYQYAFVPGMQGQLRIWYLDEMMKDRNEESETLDGLNWESQDPRPVRYRYSFDHRQKIFRNGQFLFHQNQNSDNEVNKEYFDSTVELDAHLSRTLNVSFPVGNGDVSVNYTQNDDFLHKSVYSKETDRDTHLNEQPAIAFSQNFSNLFDTPLSVAVRDDLTRYHRHYGWRGDINIAEATVGFPFFLDFLNVRPEFKRNHYWFDVEHKAEPDGETPDKNRETFDWSIDTKKLELNFELFRYFQNADQIKTGKLSFRPKIVLHKVEDVDQKKIQIVESVTPEKWIAYHLDAEYLVKDPETESVRSFFSAGLNQTFNLLDEKKAENGKERLPLRLSLSVSPVPGFGASLAFRYDHSRRRNAETSISLSNSSFDGSEFSVGYTYNPEEYYELNGTKQPKAQEYRISQLLHLSDRWELSWSGSWDVNRQNPAARYGSGDANGTRRLQRDLTSADALLVYKHDCYKISFGYREEIKDRTIGGIETEVLDRTVSLVFSIDDLPLGELYGLDYEDD